jgi:hypothetical protein
VATYQARIGLEQEFFLVDETGGLSHRADEFLDRCRQEAIDRGQSPAYFVPEFVKSIVEINTPPAYSPNELARFYLQSLGIASTPDNSTAELANKAGLQLARQCCDRLEQQIALLNLFGFIPRPLGRNTSRGLPRGFIPLITEHPLAELDARIGVLAKSLPSRDSRLSSIKSD